VIRLVGELRESTMMCCQCTILDLLQGNMHCFGVAENELGLY
jgi:hypothetical protein